MSVVAPTLRPRRAARANYRGRKIAKGEKGVDPFARNEVRLLLAGFGYQIVHVQRAVLERVTGTGWSLRRLAERVLRTPARFTVSGGRKDAEVSPSAGDRLGPAEKLLLADPQRRVPPQKRPELPSRLPPWESCERSLSPSTLHSTRQFMNKTG